jgi:hypothetical protein
MDGRSAQQRMARISIIISSNVENAMNSTNHQDSRPSATPVSPRVRKFRRLVTGYNAAGLSTIVSDADSPHVIAIRNVEDHAVTNIWQTYGDPGARPKGLDPFAPPFQLMPPASGTVIRVVEFPPDDTWLQRADRSEAFGSLGQSGSDAMHESSERHLMMHTTKTVDYAVVLEGELWAVMEDGEAKMSAGDVLIQRGTPHAWANRSDKRALILFVLVDGAPEQGGDRVEGGKDE